MSLLDKSFES